MTETYKVLYSEATAEFAEKKSRFISYLKPVETEEEAAEFIDSIKKKHWDARHNCSAAVIGKNNEFSRCSDDGEPSGTAGKPMLEVLIGEKIHNMAVVVTRYFGGTLLGTGGLVRAYQRSVKEGLAVAKILEKTTGFKLCIETDYNGVGKIQYLAAQAGVFILDSEYSDKVLMSIMVSKEDAEGFIKKVTEATNGQAKIDKSHEIDYGILDGQVIL